MTIRVAYDISLLGRFYSSYACKTGLFRVIEEVLLELEKIDSLNLSTTGLCDPQPAFGDICSSMYLQSRAGNMKPNFIYTSGSRLQLLPLYSYLMATYNSKEFKCLYKYSLPSLFTRGMLKLCSYIQPIDNYCNLRTLDFDIFHSPYFALPSKKITKSLPRILTIYDLIPVKKPEFSSKIIDSYFRKILSSIDIEHDWIISISEYTKKEFCEFSGMNPDRVFVTHLAAANHFYPINNPRILAEVKHRYSIPKGRYFLSLAALQPRKNLSHLIRCFFRFLSETKYQDVYLVLVGEKGWKYESIFDVANSRPDLRAKIVFTGYVLDEDLSSIYTGAYAFIFPSLYEGFGLPVLEAMQCGVPVISSNATSLPEVVHDAGILVDPTDDIQMCQAMVDLLENTKLCRDLQEKGIHRASYFSWQKTANQTIEVYKQAIRKNSKTNR